MDPNALARASYRTILKATNDRTVKSQFWLSHTVIIINRYWIKERQTMKPSAAQLATPVSESSMKVRL